MRVTSSKTLRVLAAAVLSAGLAACVTDGGSSSSNSFSVSNLFGGDSAKRVRVEPERFPFHVKGAITAAVMRLKGASPARVSRELSVAGSGIVAPEQGFDYSGFAVQDIELVKYEWSEDAPLNRRIEGFLHFQDGYNRHAAVSFEIAYEIVGQSPVTITEAKIAPVFVEKPVVEMYVVPGRAVEALSKPVKDYGDLYRLVRQNAIPMQQAGAPSQMADHAIFVFFQDRLPNGDELQVGISQVRTGAKSFTGATRYFAFKTGWVAAMIPGRFALSADKAFWVKVAHKAKGAKKPTLVGLFSTEAGAGPTG